MVRTFKGFYGSQNSVYKITLVTNIHDYLILYATFPHKLIHIFTITGKINICHLTVVSDSLVIVYEKDNFPIILRYIYRPLP